MWPAIIVPAKRASILAGYKSKADILLLLCKSLFLVEISNKRWAPLCSPAGGPLGMISENPNLPDFHRNIRADRRRWAAEISLVGGCEFSCGEDAVIWWFLGSRVLGKDAIITTKTLGSPQSKHIHPTNHHPVRHHGGFSWTDLIEFLRIWRFCKSKHIDSQ